MIRIDLVIFSNTLEVVVLAFITFVLLFFVWEIVRLVQTGRRYSLYDTHVFVTSPLNVEDYIVHIERSGIEDPFRLSPLEEARKKKTDDSVGYDNVYGQDDEKTWPSHLMPTTTTTTTPVMMTMHSNSFMFVSPSSTEMGRKLRTPNFFSSRAPAFFSSSVLPSITMFDWLSDQYFYRREKGRKMLQEGKINSRATLEGGNEKKKGKKLKKVHQLAFRGHTPFDKPSSSKMKSFDCSARNHYRSHTPTRTTGMASHSVQVAKMTERANGKEESRRMNTRASFSSSSSSSPAVSHGAVPSRKVVLPRKERHLPPHRSSSARQKKQKNTRNTKKEREDKTEDAFLDEGCFVLTGDTHNVYLQDNEQGGEEEVSMDDTGWREKKKESAGGSDHTTNPPLLKVIMDMFKRKLRKRVPKEELGLQKSLEQANSDNRQCHHHMPARESRERESELVALSYSSVSSSFERFSSSSSFSSTFSSSSSSFSSSFLFQDDPTTSTPQRVHREKEGILLADGVEESTGKDFVVQYDIPAESEVPQRKCFLSRDTYLHFFNSKKLKMPCEQQGTPATSNVTGSTSTSRMKINKVRRESRGWSHPFLPFSLKWKKKKQREGEKINDSISSEMRTKKVMKCSLSTSLPLPPSPWKVETVWGVVLPVSLLSTTTTVSNNNTNLSHVPLSGNSKERETAKNVSPCSSSHFLPPTNRKSSRGGPPPPPPPSSCGCVSATRTPTGAATRMPTSSFSPPPPFRLHPAAREMLRRKTALMMTNEGVNHEGRSFNGCRPRETRLFPSPSPYRHTTSNSSTYTTPRNRVGIQKGSGKYASSFIYLYSTPHCVSLSPPPPRTPTPTPSPPFPYASHWDSSASLPFLASRSSAGGGRADVAAAPQPPPATLKDERRHPYSLPCLPSPCYSPFSSFHMECSIVTSSGSSDKRRVQNTSFANRNTSPTSLFLRCQHSSYPPPLSMLNTAPTSAEGCQRGGNGGGDDGGVAPSLSSSLSFPSHRITFLFGAPDVASILHRITFFASHSFRCAPPPTFPSWSWDPFSPSSSSRLPHSSTTSAAALARSAGAAPPAPLTPSVTCGLMCLFNANDYELAHLRSREQWRCYVSFCRKKINKKQKEGKRNAKKILMRMRKQKKSKFENRTKRIGRERVRLHKSTASQKRRGKKIQSCASEPQGALQYGNDQNEDVPRRTFSLSSDSCPLENKDKWSKTRNTRNESRTTKYDKDRSRFTKDERRSRKIWNTHHEYDVDRVQSENATLFSATSCTSFSSNSSCCCFPLPPPPPSVGQDSAKDKKSKKGTSQYCYHHVARNGKNENFLNHHHHRNYYHQKGRSGEEEEEEETSSRGKSTGTEEWRSMKEQEFTSSFSSPSSTQHHSILSVRTLSPATPSSSLSSSSSCASPVSSALLPSLSTEVSTGNRSPPLSSYSSLPLIREEENSKTKVKVRKGKETDGEAVKMKMAMSSFTCSDSLLTKEEEEEASSRVLRTLSFFSCESSHPHNRSSNSLNSHPDHVSSSNHDSSVYDDSSSKEGEGKVEKSIGQKDEFPCLLSPTSCFLLNLPTTTKKIAKVDDGRRMPKGEDDTDWSSSRGADTRSGGEESKKKDKAHPNTVRGEERSQQEGINRRNDINKWKDEIKGISSQREESGRRKTAAKTEKGVNYRNRRNKLAVLGVDDRDVDNKRMKSYAQRSRSHNGEGRPQKNPRRKPNDDPTLSPPLRLVNTSRSLTSGSESVSPLAIGEDGIAMAKFSPFDRTAVGSCQLVSPMTRRFPFQTKLESNNHNNWDLSGVLPPSALPSIPPSPSLPAVACAQPSSLPSSSTSARLVGDTTSTSFSSKLQLPHLQQLLPWSWGHEESVHLQASPYDVHRLLWISQPLSSSFLIEDTLSDMDNEDEEEEEENIEKRSMESVQLRQGNEENTKGRKGRWRRKRRTQARREKQKKKKKGEEEHFTYGGGMTITPGGTTSLPSIIWPEQHAYLYSARRFPSCFSSFLTESEETRIEKSMKKEEEEERHGKPLSRMSTSCSSTRVVLPMPEKKKKNQLQRHNSNNNSNESSSNSNSRREEEQEIINRTAALPLKGRGKREKYGIELGIGMSCIPVGREEEEEVGNNIMFISTFILECICRQLDAAQISRLHRFRCAPLQTSPRDRNSPSNKGGGDDVASKCILSRSPNLVGWSSPHANNVNNNSFGIDIEHGAVQENSNPSHQGALPPPPLFDEGLGPSLVAPPPMAGSLRPQGSLSSFPFLPPFWWRLEGRDQSLGETGSPTPHRVSLSSPTDSRLISGTLLQERGKWTRPAGDQAAVVNDNNDAEYEEEEEKDASAAAGKETRNSKARAGTDSAHDAILTAHLHSFLSSARNARSGGDGNKAVESDPDDAVVGFCGKKEKRNYHRREERRNQRRAQKMLLRYNARVEARIGQLKRKIQATREVLRSDVNTKILHRLLLQLREQKDGEEMRRESGQCFPHSPTWSILADRNNRNNDNSSGSGGYDRFLPFMKSQSIIPSTTTSATTTDSPTSSLRSSNGGRSTTTSSKYSSSSNNSNNNNNNNNNDEMRAFNAFCIKRSNGTHERRTENGVESLKESKNENCPMKLTEGNGSPSTPPRQSLAFEHAPFSVTLSSLLPLKRHSSGFSSSPCTTHSSPSSTFLRSGGVTTRSALSFTSSCCYSSSYSVSSSSLSSSESLPIAVLLFSPATYLPSCLISKGVSEDEEKIVGKMGGGGGHFFSARLFSRIYGWLWRRWRGGGAGGKKRERRSSRRRSSMVEEKAWLTMERMKRSSGEEKKQNSTICPTFQKEEALSLSPSPRRRPLGHKKWDPSPFPLPLEHEMKRTSEICARPLFPYYPPGPSLCPSLSKILLRRFHQEQYEHVFVHHQFAVRHGHVRPTASGTSDAVFILLYGASSEDIILMAERDVTQRRSSCSSFASSSVSSSSASLPLGQKIEKDSKQRRRKYSTIYLNKNMGGKKFSSVIGNSILQRILSFTSLESTSLCSSSFSSSHGDYFRREKKKRQGRLHPPPFLEYPVGSFRCHYGIATRRRGPWSRGRSGEGVGLHTSSSRTWWGNGSGVGGRNDGTATAAPVMLSESSFVSTEAPSFLQSDDFSSPRSPPPPLHHQHRDKCFHSSRPSSPIPSSPPRSGVRPLFEGSSFDERTPSHAGSQGEGASADSVLSSIIRPPLPPVISRETVHRMAVRLNPLRKGKQVQEEEDGTEWDSLRVKSPPLSRSTGTPKTEGVKKGDEWACHFRKQQKEKKMEKKNEGGRQEDGLRVPVTLRYIRIGNHVYAVTPVVDCSITWYEEARHDRLTPSSATPFPVEKEVGGGRTNPLQGSSPPGMICNCRDPSTEGAIMEDKEQRKKRKEKLSSSSLASMTAFHTPSKRAHRSGQEYNIPSERCNSSFSSSDGLLLRSRKLREQEVRFPSPPPDHHEYPHRRRRRRSSSSSPHHRSHHRHHHRRRTRTAASTLSFQKNLLSIACRNDGTQRAIHICKKCMIQKADVIFLPCGEFVWCYQCVTKEQQQLQTKNSTKKRKKENEEEERLHSEWANHHHRFTPTSSSFSNSTHALSSTCSNLSKTKYCFTCPVCNVLVQKMIRLSVV